jgi:hypothetical protein
MVPERSPRVLEESPVPFDQRANPLERACHTN